MKKLLAGLAACSVVSMTPAAAQTMDQAKKLMDVWLEAQLDYNDWPSVAVSLVNKEGMIYSGAYGYANREGSVKATTDTLYSICSISKVFTSIAVMQQRDAGNLSLRDPIRKYLGWYDIKQKYPLSDEVTIEGVLSHSSGLAYSMHASYRSLRDGLHFPKLQEVIEYTKEQETLYRAWDRVNYSNLGLSLAGEVVAKVSGEDYHTYMRNNVLDPLGLSSTYTEMLKEKHGSELAIGYGASPRKGERAVIPYFNGEAMAPALGFISSANDLAKFAQWQLKLQEGEGDDVLNHNTLREMQRPHSATKGWNGAFGLGFMLTKDDKETLIGHSGGCPGYVSRISLNADKKIGGAALINAYGTNPLELIKAMFDVFGVALTPSEKTEGENNQTKSFTEYEGIYDSQPYRDENYYFQWGDQLVSVLLSTEKPLENMVKYKHIEGDTFRYVGKDGPEGAPMMFLRDDAGKVTGVIWNSVVQPKKS